MWEPLEHSDRVVTVHVDLDSLWMAPWDTGDTIGGGCRPGVAIWTERGGGGDSSMRSESGCRPPSEASTVQALMDLAFPRFAGLGDGPRQVHPPWSIASDMPASPATCRGEEDLHFTVDQMSVSSACLNLDMLSSSDDNSRDSAGLSDLLITLLCDLEEVLIPVNSVSSHGDLPEESVPTDKRQVVRRRASPPDVQIVEAAQVGRACESPRPIVSVTSGKRMPGKVSRAISRAPLTLDMTVVCTSGVAATSAPPPAVTSVPAVFTATVKGLMSVRDHRMSLRFLCWSRSQFRWGRGCQSLSARRRRCRSLRICFRWCSQDVPDEGSIFNVSPVSPGFLFRPSRGDQPPPSEGVLLPTTIDDFNDSVLGDPLTYARCEQFPGSESPMSLPVCAWLSGSAYLLEQSLLQTVLASGPLLIRRGGGGTSAIAPPMDLEDGQLLETGLPGCPYRFSEYGGQPFSDGNPAFGLQLHHGTVRLLDCSPTFWVDQLGKEQAMTAAINLQRDAGIMLSNLQILSQFATSLHRMSSK